MDSFSGSFVLIDRKNNMFFDVEVLLVLKIVLLNDMLLIASGKTTLLGPIISRIISLFKRRLISTVY